MDQHTVVSLVDEGVLTESETGDVELGREFLDAVDERIAALEANDAEALDEALETQVSSPAVRAILASHERQRVSLLATFGELGDSPLTLDEESRLQLSVFLLQMMAGFPRNDGTPANFFPIDADLLPVVFEAFDRVVVYVWRDDCPPCELMRDDLGNIAARREGVALFSVYGPEWKAFLDEQYNVVGAPTTLFIADGKIDSRLHGAHYPEVITAELEKTIAS